MSLGRLVDVGTGTGRMIELLGRRADSALGIDRSPEMLRLARGRIEASGLARAEVRRGDMYALPGADSSVDTLVLHQVLHFADDPAAVVGEAARLLAEFLSENPQSRGQFVRSPWFRDLVADPQYAAVVKELAALAKDYVAGKTEPAPKD